MASKINIIERELCGVNDIPENEMKEFTIKVDDKDYKILVAKYENKYYAIGNKCTHYSLSLANGVFYKGRVRCFAHGACFSVKTGDIEDFPGVDCLPSYKIHVNNDKVCVSTTVEELEMKACARKIKESSSRIQSATKRRKILIIGSGTAALECAETLKEEGLAENITIITKEAYPPYDRPKLSKAIDVDVNRILLKSEEYFKQNRINFEPNQTVKRVDLDNKLVYCESGKSEKIFDYNRLVIATGLDSTGPRPVPGSSLNGIFSIRSYDDANKLSTYFKQLQQLNKTPIKVLITGTAFIALETASFFTGKAEVTVICRRSPLSSQLGLKASQKVVKLHESKGIKFLINPKLDVTEFKASDDRKDALGSVSLSDGSSLGVDLCVIAVGSRVNTEFLKDTKLNLTKEGYIIVDEQMRTNLTDVYAVGDVTLFPRSCIFQQPSTKNPLLNVQHWQIASAQGKCAAQSIAGYDSALKTVPFFWTVNQGKSIRFAGSNDEYDEIVFHEDPEKKNEYKFAAFYINKNHVVAVASLDWDPLCATFAELVYNRIEILKEHIVDDAWGLKKLLK